MVATRKKSADTSAAKIPNADVVISPVSTRATRALSAASLKPVSTATKVKKPKVTATAQTKAKKPKAVATPKKAPPTPKAQNTKKVVIQEEIVTPVENNSNLQNELNSARNQLKLLDESKVALIAELDTAKASLSMKNNLIGELEGKIATLEANVKCMKEEISHLQSTNAQAENVDLEKVLKIKSEELDNVKNQLSVARNDLDQANAHIYSLANENETVANLKQANVALTESNSSLTQKFSSQENLIESLNKELTELRANFQSAHDQISQMTAKEQKSSAEHVQKLQTKAEELANAESMLNSTQSSLKQADIVISQLNGRIAAFEEQIKRHDASHENFEAEKQKVFAESTAQLAQHLKEMRERVNQNIDTQMPMGKVYEMLDETSKTQVAEIFDLQKSLKKVTAQIEQEKQAKLAAEQALQAYKSESQDNLASMHQKIDELKNENARITAEKQADSDVAKHEEEIKKLVDMNSFYKQENGDLRLQLTATTKNLEFEQQKNQQQLMGQQSAAHPQYGQQQYGFWNL